MSAERTWLVWLADETYETSGETTRAATAREAAIKFTKEGNEIDGYTFSPDLDLYVVVKRDLEGATEQNFHVYKDPLAGYRALGHANDNQNDYAEGSEGDALLNSYGFLIGDPARLNDASEHGGKAGTIVMLYYTGHADVRLDDGGEVVHVHLDDIESKFPPRPGDYILSLGLGHTVEEAIEIEDWT